MNSEKSDLPRNVVIILVILSVIISILGSWTVLQETQRLSAISGQQGTPVQRGTVSVRISEPTQYSNAVTGQVAININSEDAR